MCHLSSFIMMYCVKTVLITSTKNAFENFNSKVSNKCKIRVNFEVIWFQFQKFRNRDSTHPLNMFKISASHFFFVGLVLGPYILFVIITIQQC